MNETYDRDGNRIAPYKEDSTRGGSMIKPLNYKGDMLTQTWVDSRVIATLSVWLEKSGYYPRSISDVARRPLEVLVEHLVQTGQIEMIEHTVDAREMLSRRYRVKLNRGGRGGKNVLHNQVLSDEREELSDKVREGGKFNDVQKVVAKQRGPSAEDIERAVRIYQELEASEARKRAEEAIEKAKERGEVASSIKL